MNKRDVVKTLLLSPIYLTIPLIERLRLVRTILGKLSKALTLMAVVLLQGMPAYSDQVSTVTWGEEELGEINWDKSLVITRAHVAADQKDQKVTAMAMALQKAELIFIGICKAALPTDCENRVRFRMYPSGGIEAIARLPLPARAMGSRIRYLEGSKR